MDLPLNFTPLSPSEEKKFNEFLKSNGLDCFISHRGIEDDSTVESNKKEDCDTDSGAIEIDKSKNIEDVGGKIKSPSQKSESQLSDVSDQVSKKRKRNTDRGKVEREFENKARRKICE